MIQSASLCQTNPFLTIDMPVFDDNEVVDADGMMGLDSAGLAHAEAMWREIEEMAEALDEIAQSVIY